MLRKWVTNIKKELPEGSIVINSLTNLTWGYPGRSFLRACWACVDFFLLITDNPCTVGGEIFGTINCIRD